MCHLYFTCKKIIMTDLHWCKWGKKYLRLSYWLQDHPKKKRRKCRETVASDMQYRQKIIIMHARKSGLNRHCKISLLNCSVCVSQFDSLCTQEWPCGVWPTGFPKHRSESLCAAQQKSAEIKWNTAMIWNGPSGSLKREFSSQSENLKYLNWVI